MSDPVAALNHALTEAGRETLGYAPEGGLTGVAQKTMPYLAEQGYVLVNAEGLAAACMIAADSHRIDGRIPVLYQEQAAAILAAIQEQKP